MKSTDQRPAFPAGEFVPPGTYDTTTRSKFTRALKDAPAIIRSAIQDLDEAQLDSRYKNWSIRQIVHHLADSHMNAYIRFKWALTEASPLIKSYDETKWSEIVDARQSPIEPSLVLLEGLHARWATLVEKLSSEEMELTFFHPEIGGDVSLQQSLPSYVWHTEHHVAQILWIRNNNQW